MNRGKQAALYAREHGCTLSEAAIKFGIRDSSVSRAWRKLFAIRAPRGKRNIAHPEDEVTL